MVIEKSKKFIEFFNKNKTKELYGEVLNKYIPDASKCRCCGDSIYYYDSTFLIKKTGEVDIRNKSFKSIKTINDKDYYLSVCEDCLTKKYPEYANINKSRVFNRICDMTSFAFNIPSDVADNYSKESYSLTIEKFISKYGELDGKRRWKEYCDKQAESNSFEYKAEKHGWTKEEYDEFNKSRAVTLENLTLKHGEEKGKLVYDEYCEKQRYTCSLEYFVKEYGEVVGKEKYINFAIARVGNSSYSRTSQDIFNALRDKFPQYTLYYATNNGEKHLLMMISRYMR